MVGTTPTSRLAADADGTLLGQPLAAARRQTTREEGSWMMDQLLRLDVVAGDILKLIRIGRCLPKLWFCAWREFGRSTRYYYSCVGNKSTTNNTITPHLLFLLPPSTHRRPRWEREEKPPESAAGTMKWSTRRQRRCSHPNWHQRAPTTQQKMIADEAMTPPTPTTMERRRAR